MLELPAYSHKHAHEQTRRHKCVRKAYLLGTAEEGLCRAFEALPRLEMLVLVQHAHITHKRTPKCTTHLLGTAEEGLCRAFEALPRLKMLVLV